MTKVFTAGEVLTAADVNTYLVNTTGSGNAIINGAFDIWQRGTSVSVASGAGALFAADRFSAITDGDSLTYSQQTFTPGAAPVAGLEERFFARVSNTFVAGVNNYSLFNHRIEDVRTFAGQTVTLSYYAKADAAKSVSFEINQSFGSGGSSGVFNFVAKQALTTSWARYSHTITLPTISGKTIGANSFLNLGVWLSAGSTFNARTNSLGQQNITFDIWGVQLEAGPVATPFRRNANSIQGELAACQRYYWRGQTGSIFAYYGVGLAESATIGIAFVQPPVPMRSTASMSLDFSTLATYDGTTIRGITALTISQATTTGLALQATVASGQTANRPLFLINNNTAAGFLGISAEL
jgi:hypothetical protein